MSSSDNSEYETNIRSELIDEYFVRGHRCSCDNKPKSGVCIIGSNAGRRFWQCPKEESQQCGYHVWQDEFVARRLIDILQEIHQLHLTIQDREQMGFKEKDEVFCYYLKQKANARVRTLQVAAISIAVGMFAIVLCVLLFKK